MPASYPSPDPSRPCMLAPLPKSATASFRCWNSLNPEDVASTASLPTSVSSATSKKKPRKSPVYAPATLSAKPSEPSSFSVIVTTTAGATPPVDRSSIWNVIERITPPCASVLVTGDDPALRRLEQYRLYGMAGQPASWYWRLDAPLPAPTKSLVA